MHQKEACSHFLAIGLLVTSAGLNGGVDMQATSYQVPDAVAKCAHPVLKYLRQQMTDEARYLEVASLVRHPDVTARATADAALNSSLLTSQ